MSATEQQLEAVRTEARSVCVDAGAGSGKTRVLIERLLRLLDPRGGNVPFDEIVAITFTNKAAAEMRSRLRESAHDKPNEPGASRAFWRGLERKLDAARIDTIDAFCLKLLKEHALALGLDPEFTLLNDAEQVILRGEVLMKMLADLLEAGDPHAERLAVHTGVHDLRKTLDTMLKQRELTEAAIADWRGLDASAIAEMASTRAEAFFTEHILTPKNLEIAAALRDALSAWEGQCKKSTNRMEIARVAAIPAMQKAAAATTAAEWAEAAAVVGTIKYGNVSAKDWDDPEAKDLIKEEINACRKLFKGTKVPVEDPAVTAQAAVLVQDLIVVYDAVTAAIDADKERRQAFYFDDIMRKTVRVLQKDADLRKKVAGGIQHLLIDEFQDTDPRQLVIANLLHGEERGPGLFIVGDAKQSIYRFRGAEVGVFAEAREASTNRISMIRNHRTVPDVLAFVNHYFSKTAALEAVENPYDPMDCWRPAVEEARVEFLLPAFDDTPNKAEGQDAEAELLAARLKTMCEAAPVTVGDAPNTRPATYGDAAILLRSLNDVIAYERALIAAEVPYYVLAGKGFYEQQEVVDFRNLLAAVADPFDEMALAGFLRSPIAGLSDDALLALADEHRGLAAAFASGAMPAGFDEAAAWEWARGLVHELERESTRSLPDFVAYALDRCGYEPMLVGLRMGESRAANVRKVVELAGAFASVEGASLPRFIAYMDEVAARELQEGEASLQREGANAVAIMTIHKSKGLEFPIVCLPDLGRGANTGQSADRIALHRGMGVALRPTGTDGTLADDYFHNAITTLNKAEDAAERARILYVAMTRAQDWLLMSAGGSRGSSAWIESFKELYSLDNRGEGEVIEGEGWKAVVRREPPPFAIIPSAHAKPDPLDEAAALERARPVARVLLEGRTVSASMLLNAMADSAASPGEEHAPPPGRVRDPLVDAGTRGSMVHRLFERWDFVEEPAAAVEALLREDYPLPIGDALKQDLIGIAEFVWASELAGPMRDPATRREWEFRFRLADDALVTGVCDAVLADDALVDWKTGAFREAGHARYEQQLRLYAAAATALGHPPPRAYLVYVDERRIETVDIATLALEQTVEAARDALRRLRSEGIPMTVES